MNLSIWDKELSASEVSELYNSGAPLHVGTHSAYAANCKGWYSFQDDGTGHVSGTESFAINGDSNIVQSTSIVLFSLFLNISFIRYSLPPFILLGVIFFKYLINVVFTFPKFIYSF